MSQSAFYLFWIKTLHEVRNELDSYTFIEIRVYHLILPLNQSLSVNILFNFNKYRLLFFNLFECVHCVIIPFVKNKITGNRIKMAPFNY